MAVRKRHIQALVEKLLATHGIESAPIDVEKLAKNLGADVHYQPTDENLSGFIIRSKSRAIIGVNSKHPENRRRFTIAHEVGHLLLHDHVQDHNEVHVDGAGCGMRVRRRDQESSKGEDDHEREANFFAAELLMPAKFLEEDVADLDDADLFEDDVLGPLSKKYKVSTQALTFRLAHLGYVHA
jgi:Zn-dependent peptidase ImmA (M78 family)